MCVCKWHFLKETHLPRAVKYTPIKIPPHVHKTHVLTHSCNANHISLLYIVHILYPVAHVSFFKPSSKHSEADPVWWGWHYIRGEHRLECGPLKGWMELHTINNQILKKSTVLNVAAAYTLTEFLEWGGISDASLKTAGFHLRARSQARC